jgi:hypothetical protein
VGQREDKESIDVHPARAAVVAPGEMFASGDVPRCVLLCRSSSSSSYLELDHAVCHIQTVVVGGLGSNPSSSTSSISVKYGFPDF